MQIKVYENGPFLVNTYLVLNEKTGKAFIIDPGNDIEPLIEQVKEEKINIEAIVCTHGHIDHISGVYALKRRFNTPFYINEMDAPLLETMPVQASMFGVSEPNIPTIDHNLPTKGVIDIADITLNLLYTPGHTKGSVSLYFENNVFCGDVLFNFSIGRTDLPGGNYNILIKSIEEQLFTLPLETNVFPGHGPQTTIGREKEFNPFF